MLRLLKEDNAEEVEVKEEEIIPEKLPEEETSIEISEHPTDQKISNNACEEVVLQIVQEAWQLIGAINTAEATLDYNYSRENKDDIKNILESITDDLTVNIGMLYKISDMINAKTEKLLDTGMEKAKDIADIE